MVAHCAKQVSLSTTEAASEWNNKMIEQDYHAKVSESRAFEEHYARCDKVVDQENLRPDAYIIGRRQHGQKINYSADIISMASTNQQATSFMNETSGKRCAYEFFIHQSRHIGHAPELDETDLNEHDKAYAELTRVFSNCPHWELGGHAVSLLRRARCNFTTLGRRQRLLANTVRSTQVGQLVALDQSVAHTLEEIAAPGKG